MGRGAQVAAAAAVFLLGAACAENPGTGSGSAAATGPEPGAPAERVDPVELVGLWVLASADVDAGAEDDGDAEGGTVVRIAPLELRMWRECGVMWGTWRGDRSGLFVGQVTSIDGGCREDGEPTPAWLRRATSFNLDGDGRVLLDASGGVTARLLPAPDPAASPGLVPPDADPPEVTDEVRSAFAPSAPLPPDLAPAGRDTLVGRWVPADGPRGGPEPPHVELAADGGWRGSDGCNGQGGRWVAGPAGAFLATSGPSTLVACAGAPVGGWLAGASRAGLDSEVLVLLDAGGEETGRLRRD